MRAFKFRTAQRMGHIFDILHNRRLYCSEWTDLNDPMEGVFAYSAPEHLANDASAFASDLQEKLQGWRVCSLSGTFDSHLLWAHYANGFDGVAIEVELPDDNEDIRHVCYRGVSGVYNYQDGLSLDQTARSIIFSKNQEWGYEKEIRIRSNRQYYLLEMPIHRVIVGHRLQEALFDTIQMVCETLEIEFCSVGIGDEGLDADFVAPLAKRKGTS